jgi:hypothetical protein
VREHAGGHRAAYPFYKRHAFDFRGAFLVLGYALLDFLFLLDGAFSRLLLFLVQQREHVFAGVLASAGQLHKALDEVFAALH